GGPCSTRRRYTARRCSCASAASAPTAAGDSMDRYDISRNIEMSTAGGAQRRGRGFALAGHPPVEIEKTGSHFAARPPPGDMLAARRAEALLQPRFGEHAHDLACERRLVLLGHHGAGRAREHLA